MLRNREVLLAKIESTYNTDPVPVEGTDAIQVENLQWSPEGARMNERQSIRSSIGKLKQIYGGTLLNFSFDVEVKGSGVAGDVPELGVLLRGSAMGETIVASTSVTYAPVSTGIESVTLYYYQDGTLLKLTGARGNASCQMDAGGVPKMSFTFTGHIVSLTDVALASPTYNSAVPYAVVGTAFTVGGYAAVISSLAFDLANEIATPSSISASDGFGEVRVIGRDVQGSIDPEAVVVATNDFFSHWQDGDAMALATGALGAAGNQFAITMPAISYRNMSPADRDGVRTYDTPFGAAETTGDNEVAVAFT